MSDKSPVALYEFPAENDELDILSASSPTLAASEVPSPKVPSSGRVLRQRQLTLLDGKLQVSSESEKRPRTKSKSASDSPFNGDGRKKMRLGDKKAMTVSVHASRVQIESARRRWLCYHRDLFEPLLPDSSTIFEHMQKEQQATRDKTKYIPYSEVNEQPELVKGGVMKDYQLQGLSFLTWMYKNGMSCILGDEMGLGKTLQTLSLFAYIREHTRGSQDPHLVICPLSVLPSWLAEAARWVPSMKTLRFHGHASERQRLKNEIRDGARFDICVTTYEMFVADDNWFKTRRWTYCVLDEGHKIKNAETNISHKLQGIGALYRLLLTGTPVQNNLVELWALLHWLYPHVFTGPSERLFKDSFDMTKGSYALQFLDAAKRLLGTIMLRRTKAAVESSVPPREELTVFVPLTEAQRFWTYRLLTRLDKVDLQKIFLSKEEDAAVDQGRREVLQHLEVQAKSGNSGSQSQWSKLMNLLMQLREVCDHPYIMPGAEPEPIITGEHIVAASSKLIVIDKLLSDILPKGERVLIFSQWTEMLNILEDFMNLRKITYARLDGRVGRSRRTLDIRLFQQEISPYKVFLISTKAGGLGINLTKATTVIMCDSDWNPQNDLQAIARAHRIGQTKTVKVYRLICQGSVEDQMLDRIRRKLFLSVKVMGSDNSSASEDNGLQMRELLDILRKGSSAVSLSAGGMDLSRFLKASIEEILNESRGKEGARNAKMKQELSANADLDQCHQKWHQDVEEEERQLLSGVAQVRSRLFDGQIVHRMQDNEAIANEWKSVQKRARIEEYIYVDGIPVIAKNVQQDPDVQDVPPPKPKEVGRNFEWEEYCIYCRDGGELALCSRCPRVFHAKCRGMTAAQVRKSSTIQCGQHSCASCDRPTADAGGMLFRCRTCPQAFCEDCMPTGDIDAVGDTIPEFLLLNYGVQTTAFFVECQDCRKMFKEEPEIWEEWQEEFQAAEIKLESLSK